MNGQIVGNVLCFELFGLPTIWKLDRQKLLGQSKGTSYMQATISAMLETERLIIRPYTEDDLMESFEQQSIAAHH
ncbi:hypothetical protein BP422_10900 [Brevibacillus formosus]|uniref:Uncharacterized protein n=1 Tax=Brevibacillus formosus TaxID=54913 RepID=A0A220MGB6_9BACL|nr:hypothetical protein [Brevibacillus formosus]ASJ54003.1 hypothetical protein BP422_10900 [Brevibacillus formosus]